MKSAAAFALLALFATSAAADEGRFEARMDRLDTAVHERLGPKIGVTDKATQDKLAKILEDGARAQRTAREGVKKEREALQALVDRNAPANEIQAQLARVRTAMKAVPQKGAVLDETAKVLSPQQQAKLVLAAPKMMRERRGARGAIE